MVYQITALILHRQSQQLHSIVPRDGPDDPLCRLVCSHSVVLRASGPDPRNHGLADSWRA